MSGVTKLMTAGGGGVSLTPASSIASDVTVNVPSQNCTLGIQGPAFSAYQSSSQSISAATNTKVQFQTEVFDTNNCFDSSTNYRFTPNVAGYYQITGGVYYGAPAQLSQAYIYKNGSHYQNNDYSTRNGVYVTGLVYCNGSTDYIELYVYITSGAGLTATAVNTYFQGALVRAA